MAPIFFTVSHLSIKLNQYGENDKNISQIYKDFFFSYEEFANTCRTFFDYLSMCNIIPVVVIDGADDPYDLKLQTTFERMDKQYRRVATRCGEVLPLLSKLTFIQVLAELNVAHVACLYEADREIAVLARKWNCPVLSDDSDFFVYDIEAGCISVSQLIAQIRDLSIRKLRTSFLRVQLYTRKSVQRNLFNKESDEYIFPVFATLIGNDYFKLQGVKLMYPRMSNNILECPSRPAFIFDWLNRSNFENGREALQQISEQITGDQREQFVASVESYRRIEDFDQFNVEKFILCDGDSNAVDYSQLEEVRDAIAEDYKISKLPAWFIRDLIKCDIDCSFLLNIAVNKRLFFRAQFENLTEKSSFECSKDIRRVIFRVVLGGVSRNVLEYDRSPWANSRVRPVADELPDFPEIPDLNAIMSLTQNQRMILLFQAVCGRFYRLSREMGEASHLLILLLFAFKKKSNAKESILNALVACIIVLHLFHPSETNGCVDIVQACQAMSSKEVKEIKRRMEKHFEVPDYLGRYTIDMGVVHAVAQFQACFLHTCYLNQLLRYPVKIPSPGIVLNTALVYNIWNLFENNVEPTNMLLPESPLAKLHASWIKLIRKLG